MYIQFYEICKTIVIAAKVNINGKTKIIQTPAELTRNEALNRLFEMI